MKARAGLSPSVERVVNIPRLAIRGPVGGAMAAFVIFVGGAMVLAQFIMLDQFSVIEARVQAPASQIHIQSPRAGRIAQIFVAPGAQVKAGQLLARLSNSGLDAQIAQLTEAAQSARLALADARQQVRKALTARVTPAIEIKQLMRTLAARIKDVGQRSRHLSTRIAAAERQISHAGVYADVAGRVEFGADIAAGAQIGKQTRLFTLVNNDEHIRVRAVLAGTRGAMPRTQGRVKIVLIDAQGASRGPFEARLLSSRPLMAGPDMTSAPQTQVIYNLTPARSQIAKHIALQSGMQAKVLISSGQRSLFHQLF